MSRFVPLLLWVLSLGTDEVQVRGQRDFNGTVVTLDVDLSTVVHRVDPRFLSVTIDASLTSHNKFIYLLGSIKFRTLTRALSPAFLRFGGTRQDFMVFTPRETRHSDSGLTAVASCEDLVLAPALEERLKKEWTEQQTFLLREELQRNYSMVTFTESTVDVLHSFANCSGLDLIFGLNALLRSEDHSWNSSNARALLQYCQSRRYRMSWELGNEPNSYMKKAGVQISGFQLGLDFSRLREMMSEFGLYRGAGLYGPDTGQLRGQRKSILDGFLESGSDAIDACTWHHYYVDGRNTSLEDFLDPDILDSLTLQANKVLERVKLLSPGKPVWLGETSSAYGGGAMRLSDSFVAGFMWLDKLGLAAQLGLDVVMRQSLIGFGNYNLVNSDLDPLPDYWLSLLYKKLVGPEVLRAQTIKSPDRRVRAYLHCSHPHSYRRGAVTLFSMNLGASSVRISVPSLVSSGPVVAFVLQSDVEGEEGLYSRSVKLNGRLLEMVDDKTLPDLRGASQPLTKHLHLPAFSLAFFVFPDARAAACQAPAPSLS